MSPSEANAFERDILNLLFEQEAMNGLDVIEPHQALADIEKLQKRAVNGKKSFNPVKLVATVALLLAGVAIIWQVTTNTGQDKKLAMQQQEIASDEGFRKEPGHTPPEASAVEEEKTEGTADDAFQPLDPPETRRGTKSVPDKEAGTRSKKAPKKTVNTFKKLETKKTVSLNQSVATEGAPARRGRQNGSMETAFRAAATDSRGISAPADPPGADEAKEDPKKSGQANSGKAIAAAARNRNESRKAMPSIGQNAYRKYLAASLRYPAEAKKYEIEGPVKLKFTVSRTGDISNIKVKKGPGFGCEKEAVRLVKEGPKWAPELVNGKAKTSTVAMTVNFKL